MKKNEKLNLGKIRIVNFNVAHKLFGGDKTDSCDSCGDDICMPEITQTNTGTREINVCNSNFLCTGTD